MIEVAAGILTDASGRVLLMQRLPGTHLAGLWEFPGGKLEANEGIAQALARELHEELGIDARACVPLISIPWRYPEKAIRLHALSVTDWRGEPRAREGHSLRWMRVEDIDPAQMPAADRPILTALRLPARYVITPAKAGRGHFSGPGSLGKVIALKNGSDRFLLQLRLPERDRDEVRAIAEAVLANAPLRNRLLVNHDIALARELGLGVHLRAAQVRELAQRPLSSAQWVGASCHDADELEHAARLGADFATLSPVCASASHPGMRPLGWERFAELVREARLPVFALGGVGPRDLQHARAAGAQGVAGISAFAPPL
ncbi:MAG TPA: Nudix family hydrolase [Rhodanobacteraceae bacterium]|nr:Nudix family hydrolase [Rhodanobacteraceae bacterium]